MTSGRAILAAHLAATLPGWQIVADARALDTIRKPGACVLWTAKRSKLSDRETGWYRDDLILWALTATDKATELEDDLDGMLLQVMESLEAAPAFHWEDAERGQLEETFPGYRLPVTCVFQVTPEPDNPETEPEE